MKLTTRRDLSSWGSDVTDKARRANRTNSIYQSFLSRCVISTSTPTSTRNVYIKPGRYTFLLILISIICTVCLCTRRCCHNEFVIENVRHWCRSLIYLMLCLSWPMISVDVCVTAVCVNFRQDDAAAAAAAVAATLSSKPQASVNLLPFA